MQVLSEKYLRNSYETIEQLENDILHYGILDVIEKRAPFKNVNEINKGIIHIIGVDIPKKFFNHESVTKFQELYLKLLQQ